MEEGHEKRNGWEKVKEMEEWDAETVVFFKENPSIMQKPSITGIKPTLSVYGVA